MSSAYTTTSVFSDIRNDDHLDEFYLIEQSTILDSRHWESGDNERFSGCRLPPRQVKKYSKCVRLVDKAIDLNTYRTRLFPFSSVMDEASQTWRKSLGEKCIKSVLGFGSYES